jgi:hypothetical protein
MCETDKLASIKKYLDNKLAQSESRIFTEICSNMNSNCVPGRDGRNGIKGDKGDKGDPGIKGDVGQIGLIGPPGLSGPPDLISFGATGVAPINNIIEIVANYLVPFGRTDLALSGVIGNIISLTIDTNFITQILPFTTTRIAKNPVVTVTVLFPITGDLVFTLGTITNNGLTGTFTPSLVVVTIPTGSLIVGTLAFSNLSTDIFLPGSRLAVRVTTNTGLSNIGIGVSTTFNFELS